MHAISEPGGSSIISAASGTPHFRESKSKGQAELTRATVSIRDRMLRTRRSGFMCSRTSKEERLKSSLDANNYAKAQDSDQSKTFVVYLDLCHIILL